MPTKQPNVLLLITGPTGCGKSTLCERIVTEQPDIGRVVTATERTPRPGEVDGSSYHFLTPGEFDESIAEGDFVEWALVHQKHRYGVLKSAMLEQLNEKNLALVIDVQGVRSLRAANLPCQIVSVFMAARADVLKERILGRDGHGDPADVARRMQSFEREMQERHEFDHVIESGSREQDYQALLKIWSQAKSPGYQSPRVAKSSPDAKEADYLRAETAFREAKQVSQSGVAHK
jgi:guanylate kinase